MVSPLLARLSYLTGLSTAPSTLDVDLAAVVGRALELKARRVQSAADASAERSERIRAAIRQEGGVLPAGYGMGVRVGIVRRRIGLRLGTYLLTRAPSARVIRGELAAMDAERKDGRSESERRAAGNSVRATHPTTGDRP